MCGSMDLQHDAGCCGNGHDSSAKNPFLFLATGRLPPGAAFPVHRLAGLQGHAPLEALHPPVGPEIGEVAGTVRRRRREDCGALPVSKATRSGTVTAHRDNRGARSTTAYTHF